jgi:hypothetical protein
MQWPHWLDPQDPRLSRCDRPARIVAFRGELRSLKDLAAEHGQPLSRVRYRIDRLGWPIEAALKTPKGERPRPTKSCRPCPVMKCHAWGYAYVAYKVRGRRRCVYFGPWGTEKARAMYKRFAREWPRQLTEEQPRGQWPARRMLTHDGRTQSLARWAREFGIKASTLRWRLDVAGIDLAGALSTPLKARAQSKERPPRWSFPFPGGEAARVRVTRRRSSDGPNEA